MNISHTWVQDMTIYLIGPEEIGSPTITLFEEACGGQDDIDVTVDDSGTSIVCASNPAISGTVLPFQPLNAFNGVLADGEWTLFVIDKYNNDGGTINSVSLSFCNSVSIENDLNFTNNGIITEINSVKTITLEEMNAFTTLQAASNQVYTLLELPSLGVLKKENTPLIIGDIFTQEDINLNKINYTNSLSDAASDFFKVNIINASSAWLPNVVIPITIENNLSLIENETVQALIYPNPTNGKVTVSWFENLETNIDLFDLQGRIILSKKINTSDTVVDLNEFSDGIYLISIQNEKIKTTRKIVLRK
jgi:subtilisin-like proprotein convertase family protein